MIIKLYSEWLMRHYCKNLKKRDLNLLFDQVSDQYAKITYFDTIEDINLYLLDLTTGTTFGSFKSLVGFLTVVRILEKGYKEIVFVSSGNTGNNIIGFLKPFDIKINYFLPSRSIYKINPDLYNPKMHRIFAVEGNDADTKRLARKFGEINNIPYIPDYDTQIEANKVRAKIIVDFQEKEKIQFDWLSQSLSAGYGPIGTYYGYKELNYNPYKIPKFLGIQQENNCPYAALSSIASINSSIKIDDFQSELVSPTLFNTDPGKCVNEIKNIFEEFGGEIFVVSDDDYSAIEQDLLDQLKQVGLDLTVKTTKTGKKVILENASLYTLAGSILAIKEGIIDKKQNILVSVTGGCERQRDEIVTPTFYKEYRETDELFLNRICGVRNFTVSV
jgi:threonine synthase